MGSFQRSLLSVNEAHRETVTINGLLRVMGENISARSSRMMVSYIFFLRFFALSNKQKEKKTRLKKISRCHDRNAMTLLSG